MMCDVLKSSKRGIRFPFKTRTPLLSLLQILAFEANNILIMKQIKQLPLCYPLSGFTTLIISNSLWCWCLPKKPLTRPPLTHHGWSEKARTLSKTFFLWSAPSALTWPGAQLSPLPFVVTGQQLTVRTQGALFIARFVCSAEPDPHQQRTFFWILRKLDVFRLSAAAIVLVPAPMSHLTPILPVSSFLLNVFLIYLSGVEI